MFTDASFNARLRRATWASWIKHNGTTFRDSGIVVAECAQSGDGELAAIANGLHKCKHHLGPLAGARIIAQTDSQEAIDALRKREHPRRYAHEVTRWILFFTVQHNVRVEFRHVKGHKGMQDRRSAVNTWCDKECKRQMGLLLAQAAAAPIIQPSEPEIHL